LALSRVLDARERVLSVVPQGRKDLHMDWLKLIDGVLACTTILLTVGIAAATVLTCLVYDKATSSPENFAKVLATIREQIRWVQPGPHE